MCPSPVEACSHKRSHRIRKEKRIDLVESQLALNEGLIVAGERTSENTTPTEVEEFLKASVKT